MKEKLNLFNTLIRKKEEFIPISKKVVGLYSCGPTVYWYQHVGNMRTYIFSDILKRVLLYNNHKVRHVMNITDVGHLTSDSDTGEDKIESAAKKEGKKAEEIAEYYLKVFQQDMEKLNIISPSIWCKATDHIKEQIDLIKILEKKKYTYKTEDGIYFNSSKFKNYNQLAKLNIKQLKAGKRIDVKDKKHKTDFALWKFSDKESNRQQEWKSPFGVGFPGWHIECSAMSMKYLGDSFDIHTGGEDHIPVHHTNEIAQSEASTGKKFVNYWLHGAFLLDKEGNKVSKSKGGLYTISELEEKGYSPIDFRYLCLLTHYKKPLHFSLENLDSAKKSLERIKRKVIETRQLEHKGIDSTTEYKSQFLKAINDDMNMPEAIQVLHKLLDDFDFNPNAKINLLEDFDKVLGLKIKEMQPRTLVIPKDIQELIDKREVARKKKKWAEADTLRNIIKEKGYLIEDREDGVVVNKV